MLATDMTGIVLAAALAVLAAEPAMPQMRIGDVDAEMHTVQQTYDVETFGAFRNIMMSGDFIARVRLDTLMARHPTTGVGALADALGEITICDGSLIVTYGKVPPTNSASEAAALLVTVRVDGWQGVPVENDVPAVRDASRTKPGQKHRSVKADMAIALGDVRFRGEERTSYPLDTPTADHKLV